MKRMKKDGHGSNTGNPVNNNRRPGTTGSHSNAANKKSNPMQTQLSVSEKRVFEKLRNVSEESLWGLGIKKAIEANDPGRFRSLIEQLQSQAKDNRDVMRKILGNAYSSVMRLRVVVHSC